MPGFVLLVRPRGDEDPTMRFGITVTRKIGGAVVRNRMKRRFRALARELLPLAGLPGGDHVLIGRAGGVERAFSLLRDELRKALRKVAGTASPALAEGRDKTNRASTGSALGDEGSPGRDETPET